MNATTRPRMAYRDVLIGILTGIDEQTDPDIEQLLYTFLDELKEANPFDVALGCFELVTRLAAELGQWTGQSRTETLRTLAASVATNPIP